MVTRRRPLEPGRVALSGWCNGPAGARPKCRECRSDRCGCACHTGAQHNETAAADSAGALEIVRPA